MRSLDIAWRDMLARFSATIASLDVVVGLVKPLPTFELARSSDSRITAQVRQPRPSSVVIEIGAQFLADLSARIEGIDADDLDVLLALEDRENPLTAADARIVLHAMAEQFIVHHDLFHVLGGHVAHDLAASGASARAALAFSEPNALRLGQAPGDTGSAMAPELELSLYRELEGDDSALQLLADHCAFEDLAASLDIPPAPVAAYDGDARVIGFRLLFAAAWLVLLALEPARDEFADESGTHPWPAARLLSLLFTLLQHFVGPAPMREDERGQQFMTLSAATLDSVRGYLMDVVRPTMKFVVAQADGARVVALFEQADPGRSDLFADVLLDLKGLFLDQEVRTPAGRQLLALLVRRSHFRQLFAPYRLVAL
jgi:hypothetical protein